jgi:peptide subunit release factor 1 (eRF1)
MGKADIVLLSEGLEWSVIKYQCQKCNQFTPKIIKDNLKKPDGIIPCQYCESDSEEFETVDLYDYLSEVSDLMEQR